MRNIAHDGTSQIRGHVGTPMLDWRPPTEGISYLGIYVDSRG